MKRLHLICNAHLDPVWQWTWDEGIAAAISTFSSAADLADEFDYIFCHNEALLYEAVENFAPELFERIKKLVAAGRWKIIGGWYLQPDCNMPHGESFVRQIKTGHSYFYEKFGVIPTVACNFDSFGHSVGLPQIMKKCGYTGYIVSRPGRDAFDFPGRFFRWRSPDGSEIIVARVDGYGSGMGHALEKITNSIGNAEDVDTVLWGVGNHGGGPSRKDLADIASFRDENVEIFHSSPEDLFADDIKISGTVKRSLRPSMPGCYTSMMKVKQAHRKAENLLYSTEKLMTVAAFSGCKFDYNGLYEAQKKMLLAEFHDILPGSGVTDAESEGLELLSAASKFFRDCRTKAFLHLATGHGKAEAGEYPIFVFNYMPYPVTCPVEAEFTLADQQWDENFITLPDVYLDGRKIKSQQIKENATLNLDWRKRIVFEGELKPLSVTRFSVFTHVEPKQEKTPEHLSEKELVERCSVLDAPVSLIMYDDTADPWGMSGEELKTVGRNPVEFRSMTTEESKNFCAVNALEAEHIIEDGDIYTGLEKFVTCGNTNAVIEYRFYKNQPYTDLKVTLEFADKNKLVRLRVPVPDGTLCGDGPYVTEDKESCETVFRNWLGNRTGDEITAVINDCIYAGRQNDGAPEFTLVRGSGYLFHPIGDRDLYPQDRYLPRIDCGRYVYNFRVAKGNVFEITRLAEEFQQKPYAVNVFPLGTGEKTADIHTDRPVIMPVCKPSEDGAVMRFYNPAGECDRFRLTVGDSELDVELSPAKVASVVLKDGKLSEIRDEMPV